MGKREYCMLQGISNGENGFYNPACNISYEEYREWLKKEDDISKGVNLPEGWVPATTYFLYIANRFIVYMPTRADSLPRSTWSGLPALRQPHPLHQQMQARPKAEKVSSLYSQSGELQVALEKQLREY